ncbi:hypothetical protein [Algoriphagus taiwanensis]
MKPKDIKFNPSDNSLFFTLCSNNYLSFALSLGQSIKSFDTEVKFVIGLVDRLNPQIDYSVWSEFEFLPCSDLGFLEFDLMLGRYDIVEFNTAVKPFFFEYLFANNTDINKIYYLDPDIYFYKSTEDLDLEWGDAQILLTPNLIYSSDKPSAGELASLRHGMFNLGFIGLKRGEVSFRLLTWWKERLKEHCRIDKCWGIFVDQKWMDLAPLFFDRIKVVRHPGWNMAWWNFSERKLLKAKSGFLVNSLDIPLVFFHFSGFKPENVSYTARLKENYSKDIENEVLAVLYENYKGILLKNGYDFFSKILPSLEFRVDTKSSWQKVGKKLKSRINKVLDRIFQV